MWKALPKMLNIQGEAGLEETHPVCWRENRHLVVQSVQNAVFFGHHFMHNLGWVQRWHVEVGACPE